MKFPKFLIRVTAHIDYISRFLFVELFPDQETCRV